MLLCALTARAAPPSWSHLFPSGAPRGETVEVEIVDGKYASWPVEVWTSGGGLDVKAAETKGRLEVTVAPDARPGLRWLRLHDAEGATSPRPFIIGTLPERLEKEPNDTIANALAAADHLDGTTVVVNGRLGKHGDVDTFALRLAEGQTLVASLLAHRLLRSPMDGVLQIVSAEGFVLETNDDDEELDPRIVFETPEDGIYIVRTFAFPAEPNSSIRFSGEPEYVYRLTLTTGGFVDHTRPLAVTRGAGQPVEAVGWNIPAAAAQLLAPKDGSLETRVELSHAELGNTAFVRVVGVPSLVEAEHTAKGPPARLQLPCALSGRLAAPGEVDAFSFECAGDQKLVFRLDARSLGSPADPVITLWDAARKKLAEVDDTDKRRDAELTHTFKTPGEYRVEVRDLHGRGGRRYVYLLTAGAPEPDFELAVDADRFTVPAGGSVEIPVTVKRAHGFQGDVEVAAVELPGALRADPVVSKGTGDSAKAVKLTVHAAEGAVSGPVRIVGRSAALEGSERPARVAVKELEATVARAWITVTAPKS